MISKRLVLIGTDDGSIYQLDILTFDDALLSTCHTGAILDIAFPKVLLLWYEKNSFNSNMECLEDSQPRIISHFKS